MRRDSEGFTLLELVVALGIAAMTLTVLFQLFSEDLRGAARSQAYTRAVLLAQSRLDEAGVTAPLTAGVESGNTDDLAWEVDTDRLSETPIGGAAGHSVLYGVRVSVSWREGQAQRAVALRSFRMAVVP